MSKLISLFLRIIILLLPSLGYTQIATKIYSVCFDDNNAYLWITDSNRNNLQQKILLNSPGTNISVSSIALSGSVS